jgi:23S rRNA pseudouridine2605 synthase
MVAVDVKEQPRASGGRQAPSMRLAKYLAHAGVASRRAAETLVSEGRVRVRGEVVRDPALDVDENSEVEVDGRVVSGPEERVVYAVNKPSGVLSTASDPHERPTIVGMVGGQGRRLYPVGRLDADSTGLILLTNDGALAHRLTHPSFHIAKTYRVRVDGAVGERALRALREGVELEDGRTAPASVRRLAASELEITIHEGRNRQVRRMCEAVGHPVLALERVAFGPLRIGDLPRGGHRRLSDAELRLLRAATEDRGVPAARRSPGGRGARGGGVAGGRL